MKLPHPELAVMDRVKLRDYCCEANRPAFCDGFPRLTERLPLAQGVFQSFRGLLQLPLEGFHLLGNCREFLFRDHSRLCHFVSRAVSSPHCTAYRLRSLLESTLCHSSPPQCDHLKTFDDFPVS